jgi:hypothetical protein
VPTRLIITYPLILLLIVGAAAPLLNGACIIRVGGPTLGRGPAGRKPKRLHAAKLQKGAGDG